MNATFPAFIILTMTCISASSQTSSQIPGLCLPPSPPLVDSESLAILQTTAGEEYSRYFSEAQGYMMCLDATKALFADEVNSYVERYRAELQD